MHLLLLLLHVLYLISLQVFHTQLRCKHYQEQKHFEFYPVMYYVAS